MAWVQVQLLSNSSAAGQPTVTPTVPVDGDLMLAAVATDALNANVAMVASGAAWNQAEHADFGTGSVTLFWKIASGESATQTTNIVSPGNSGMVYEEWSGNGPAGFDVGGVGADSVGLVTSESCGSTGALHDTGELIIAACRIVGAFTGANFTASVFTLDAAVTRLMVGSLVAASAASQTTTAGWTTARRADGIIAAFRVLVPSAIVPWQSPYRLVPFRG